MHINYLWSKASRPAQLLAMLVTTALVILGVTSLPTYAAAPTLKLAINADEDSYLSGVEQRYVVEFSCASTTEDCLNSVVTITLPHTITPAGSSNPDSAPDGVNATATAGNKVVTPEIKRPTATTDGLVLPDRADVYRASRRNPRQLHGDPRRHLLLGRHHRDRTGHRHDLLRADAPPVENRPRRDPQERGRDLPDHPAV